MKIKHLPPPFLHIAADQISYCTKVHLVSILFLLLTSFGAVSQKAGFEYLANKDLKKITKSVSSEGFITYKEDVSISPAELFVKHKAAFDLTVDDEMRILKIETDELGMSHYRYKQYYKGIEVEGSDYLTHTQQGKVVKSNGELVSNLNLNTKSSLTEKQALSIALSILKAEKYAWQDESLEKELKSELNDPKATYYPKGTLLFVKPYNTDVSANNFVLAYKFRIQTLVPDDILEVYINANTGTLVNKLPVRQNCGTPGTAVPYFWSYYSFYGNQSIGTTLIGSQYQLVNCRTEAREGNGSGWGGLSCYFDSDNHWTVGTQGSTAYWAINKSWDYFQNTFGRNGPRNQSTTVRIQLKPGQIDQASFTDCPSYNYDLIQLGKSSGGTWIVPLDICAHEFTHGITTYTAGLKNGNIESRTLNEGFSDIFGEVIERYTFGSNNWIYGNDMGGIFVRNLKNPALSSTASPDFYEGPNWLVYNYPNNESAVTHTNCTVLGKWFYLLSEGSSGVTTFNNTQVSGIGMTDAALIAYRALTVYLTTNATYASARTAAISAAKDLFGECANQVKQVTNAWAAVNVGSTFGINLYGPVQLCTSLGDLNNPQYYSTCPNATNVTWSFPSGWSYSLSNNNTLATVTYIPAVFGNYTVSVSGNVLSQQLSKTMQTSVQDCGNYRLASLEEPRDELSVTLSPNPVADKLEILISSFPTQLELTAPNGKIVAIKTATTANETFNVSNLPVGAYVLSAQSESKVVHRKVMIVR